MIGDLGHPPGLDRGVKRFADRQRAQSFRSRRHRRLFAGNGAVDYSGSVTASYCLFQSAPTGSVTGSNNLTGVDPKLDTSGLANNGGPTETIALEADSPAIGAGANPDSLFTDQRGDAPRTGSGGTDIGAYQFGAAADTLAPTASLQAALVNGSNAAALSPYTFTIIYNDNVAITPASLSGSIVKVVPPGAGTPIAVYSDNLLPVPAKDARGKAAIEFKPILQRGQFTLSQPRAVPSWG